MFSEESDIATEVQGDKTVSKEACRKMKLEERSNIRSTVDLKKIAESSVLGVQVLDDLGEDAGKQRKSEKSEVERA